ncbi:M60 family metallopeptidase [Actinokineospora sp.]|uniref:M60 family metallopeptidase n=1 Tax=Actinokineospora sp. TaxID=1872133 RepID=UPI003D6A9494
MSVVVACLAACESPTESTAPTTAEAPKDPRRITFSPLPSAEDEQVRTGRSLKLADFQPTGWYLPPDTDLTITVDRPDSARPEVVVGPSGLGGSENDARTYPLSGRANTVRDPKGGAIHLRHTGAGTQQIAVTIGPQATPIPLYTLGQATKWASVLGQAGAAPLVQLVSAHVVLTATLDTARRYAGEDVDELLRTYDKIIEIEDGISGHRADPAVDRVSPLRYYISEGKAEQNPDAGDYRIHWPADLMDEAFTVAGLRASWGMWHELGHLHQQQAWEWLPVQEVTVNVYSLAVERAFGTASRLTGERAFAKAHGYLALPDGERDYDRLAESQLGQGDGVWIMLAMFEQLRLGGGDGFFPRLHQLCRAEQPGPQGDAAQYFMVAASKAVGVDLTGFFSRWGLRPDDGTRAEIAALGVPGPDQDFTTLGY